MIGLERDVLVSFGSGHVRRSNVDTEMGTFRLRYPFSYRNTSAQVILMCSLLGALFGGGVSH